MFNLSRFTPNYLISCYNTTVCCTSVQHTLVLVSQSSISMLELTVPTNSHQAIQAARDRKMKKHNYQHLIGDLENTFNLPKHGTNQILLKLARTSVSCSYHIFNSRNSLSWDSNKPFCCIWNFELFKLLVLTLMLFQLRFYTLYFFVPCQAPHLGGSTLSPRLKCIHVVDCIAN